MRAQLRRRTFLVCCAALVIAIPGLSIDLLGQAGKRPLTYDVFDAWRSIQGTTLSRDGQWLAYAVTAQAIDGELIVRNLQSGQEYRHPRGISPEFTADGRFVVFSITPTKADEERQREQERRSGRGQGRGENQAEEGQRSQPRNSAGIMNLSSGQVSTVERIGSISLAEESSAWVALHRGTGRAGGAGRGGRGAGRGGGPPSPPPATPAANTPGATTTPPPTTTPPATGTGRGGQQGQAPAETESREAAATPRGKRKDAGNDLILRNLSNGQDVVIPLVTDFAWNRDGSWMAYGVSSQKAEEDGAFARRMSDGTVRALQKGKGNYKSFAFDEAGKQLAFLTDQAEYDKEVSPYRLYLWKPGETAASELVSAATRGLPLGMVVSDQAAPRFSEDGDRLFLGTAPTPPAPAPDNASELRQVDLWHWKDPLLQPMQRVRAQQERNRSYRAVVHLADKRFVQLATPDMPTVNPGEDPSRTLATDDLPYRHEVSWDSSYGDSYLVDLKTGQRKKIAEHFRAGSPQSLSPGGRYVLYFDEGQNDWFTYRVADGTRVNLTEKLGPNFWREDHDSPNLPPAYGTAGWTADDRSILLYDKYDIWEIRADGSGARMVTSGGGRRQQIVFRYRSLDAEQRTIPADRPLLLSANEDKSEDSGFYRVALNGTAAPEKIIMLPKAFGQITKAKNADRLVVTVSRFDEFPDLWVTDTSFRDLKKVSNANPQQGEYVWGKTELIKYRNADGKDLRAILAKPDNFDPAKKYPLMVYIYEELSEGLHSYRAPGPGTSINITRYVSNGYVVLMPDIVYDTGYPGESAEKCVIPAVNEIVSKGYIDPKRIGIQGHSWGGYQITHLITRTNMFAAVQAGASVSNMISAYGGIRWGTGMSRAFQYEKTQSRIGAPPWDAPLQFIENSPIFWVEKVKTPYLSIHNDEDDAVPWYQGIEFFSALRRLGKEAYMFVYNGEPHGLRNRDNMKHWTVHQDEFFDHYLLGKPAPEWMEKGVPFLERGKRDVTDLFKPKDPKATTDSASR
jgi:dipeptidyl aminopeptidase/acylaminoacyl peptidase